MIQKKFISLFFTLVLTLVSFSAYAQFEEPEFEKVTDEQRAQFMNRFQDIKWTGQGLYEDTQLDDMPTHEIRARLQTIFGSPTQTLEDLIHSEDFRPGQAIEFEYWFVVDGKIPMMVLDVDGPFGEGLVFGGASKYVDLMPQIKRTFAQKLMEADSLSNYKDYFYSPEREQWFRVRYQDGEHQTKKIESPEGMSIDF